MDKHAQPYSPEEAKKWVVEGPERWDPKEGFESARRFFQVWNKKRGTKRASKRILADEPLRCTIWRDRAMDYEKLLQDLIAEALPAYGKALEQVLPELERAAESNPELKRKIAVIQDIISGQTGKRLKEDWEHERYKLEQEPKEKKIQPATKLVAQYYYKALEAVPALQKKFVELVAKDIYTNFEAGAGGYWAGYTTQKEARRLLTFFLMQDPYPYFRSEPLRPNGEKYTKETVGELCSDWGGGKSSEENPAPGRALSKKVATPFTTYKCPNGGAVVKNSENSGYNFAALTGPEAGDPKLQGEKLAEILAKTRTAALFDPTFALAKNVFKSPDTNYKDKGITLNRLVSARIDESDRDVTELQDGGLFWVPKGGLPKPMKGPDESVKVQPSGKFQLPPKEQNLADGLKQVFGQEASSEESGTWIDDQGKAYASMEQLLAAYDKEREEAAEQILPKSIAEAVRDDLEGAIIPEAPMYDIEEEESETRPVEEDEEEKIIYPWDQQEEEEEELVALPLAAQKIQQLIRLANTLDSKGLSEQANVVDEVIRGLVDKMTRQNL